MFLRHLFPAARLRGAALDTKQGETQNTKSRDPLPRQGRKKPLQSRRLLARLRYHHRIAAPQENIILLEDMGSKQHPVPGAPAQAGRENVGSSDHCPPCRPSAKCPSSSSDQSSTAQLRLPDGVGGSWSDPDLGFNQRKAPSYPAWAVCSWRRVGLGNPYSAR